LRKFDPILMAAKDAFIANGFAKTSMDDIATRAKTTKRTVYSNFGSKEQLLEAVIDHSIALLETSVPSLKPSSPKRQITRYFTVVLELMTWRAAIGMQRLIIAEGAAFPLLTDRLATRTSSAICHPLEQFIAACGLSHDRAYEAAVSTIANLTARARLDRLLGIRQAYSLVPGENHLDDADRNAVEIAVTYLGGLR
jgi:AcrR family transcriptional regulator